MTVSPTWKRQTYTYDSSGDNITGTGHTLSWDNQGALSEIKASTTNSTTYSRDALGRVLSEEVLYSGKTNYTNRYDGALDTPAYVIGSFSGGIESYLNGGGGLTMTYAGNRTTGIPIFSYSDMRGDVVAMAGMSGKFIGTKGPSSYSAFGAQLSGATDPVTDGSYGFLGKDQKETASSVMGMENIVLMGARPYDPLLGRFLSVDPVVHGSANDYDYVNQDPVNGLDLAGTDCGFWCSVGNFVYEHVVVTATFCAIGCVGVSVQSGVITPHIACCGAGGFAPSIGYANRDAHFRDPLAYGGAIAPDGWGGGASQGLCFRRGCVGPDPGDYEADVTAGEGAWGGLQWSPLSVEWHGGLNFGVNWRWL